MHQYFYQFVLCATFFLSAPVVGLSQNNNSIETTAGFNGRIRTIVEYNFSDAGSRGFNVKTGARFVKSYDLQGRLVKELVFDANKIQTSRSSYKYNEDGTLAEERNYTPAGKFQFANLYTYDNDGRELTMKNYNAEGLLFIKAEYIYDSRGNLIKETTKDADEVTINIAKWKYDSHDNAIQEETYDADLILTKKSLFVYDTSNNMIEETILHYGMKVKNTYKYDSLGRVVEECNYNGDGQIDKKVVTSYDEKSSVSEEKYFSGDDKIQKVVQYKNSYDNRGNLLSRIMVENGKEIIVERREIAYY